MELALRVLAVSTFLALVGAARVKHHSKGLIAVNQEGCDVSTLDWNNPSEECLAPVPAAKRHHGDPDSFIPSVFSRLAFSPSTHGVEDLELGPYTGQGKILVYTTSKYLVEMANGLFFNSGVHTSELLLPLYHFARAGFEFDFVTRDGLPIALEEWTFPMATAADGFPAFEDKLRATATTYHAVMNSPKRTSDIPKDLSGYLGIFIPGGHGPLVEFHLDSDLGSLLRQAHTMELPIMTLCHGPTALRAAALGGDFPFRGYKTKIFPDASDDWSPSVGYLPGHLKPEDHAGAQLVSLGMELVGTELDDSVYQDRELITAASNLGAQKFAELAITTLLAKYQPGLSLASLGQSFVKAAEAGCDMTAVDWRNVWTLIRQRRACMAPVPAEKRTPDEPDSFIPSVFARLFSSPSTQGVEDLELGPYTGRGTILVYTTSKYLVEMANGLFFNSGVHTSELLLPLYHFARAGFNQFEFVTRDGLPVALEEWTFPLATAGAGFPAFEDKLRMTAATHLEAMNSPSRTSEIPKDLSGYLGIFIPGGHGPLVEFHLDSDLGALLRQAHSMELPIMTLCHGPTALRAAALGGDFPFSGYKTKVFPDSSDDFSPRVGYLPGHLKPEDHAGARLTELGMEIVGDDLDDSVYQDRELITGASNLGAQKFAELSITSLLAKYQN